MDEKLMAALHENITKLNDLGKRTPDDGTVPLNTVFNTAAKQASHLTTLLQELTQEDSGSYNRYSGYSREEPYNAYYEHLAAQFPRIPTHHRSEQAHHSTKPSPAIRVFVPTDNKETAAKLAERIKQTTY